MNPKRLISLLMVAFACSSQAVSFTGLYTQDFNTLATSGTSSAVPAGWALAESGTSANTTYTAGTGSGTIGNTYSFGSTSDSDRAFGGLQSGSLIPIIGVGFENDTGSAINSLFVSYTGEQWRLGTAGRAIPDRLDFQYSLDATSLTTGTWTDFDGLDFIGPGSGSAGIRDGNLAANKGLLTGTLGGLSIANGSTFWLRWTDYNATDSDDGLAVDDFSLRAQQVPDTLPFGFTVAIVGLLVFSHRLSTRRCLS